MRRSTGFEVTSGGRIATNEQLPGHRARPTSIFLNEMRRADVQPIAPARIDMTDVIVDECVVAAPSPCSPVPDPRTTTGSRPTASFLLPPSVEPFIGNGRCDES